MFDAKNAELHLGILQNKLIRLKGLMNLASMRMDMDKPEEKGIDPETEKLNFAKHDKAYRKIEKAIEAYEDQVLLLTKLT